MELHEAVCRKRKRLGSEVEGDAPQTPSLTRFCRISAAPLSPRGSAGRSDAVLHQDRICHVVMQDLLTADIPVAAVQIISPIQTLIHYSYCCTGYYRPTSQPSCRLYHHWPTSKPITSSPMAHSSERRSSNRSLRVRSHSRPCHDPCSLAFSRSHSLSSLACSQRFRS